MMDRIVKLEDDLRVLRLTSGYDSNESRMNGNIEDMESWWRLRLRMELTDVPREMQIAHEHALKLERLMTKKRAKFNGPQITNGPDSLPSDHEHDMRTRRTSNPNNNLTNSSTNLTNLNNLSNLNSNNTLANSTVVFGPVTDL